MVVIYQSPEIITRIFAFLLISGTAALAGILIYRTTNQALPATVIGLLFLAPFTGVEAVVWTSALAHFVPAGFFALLSLNTFLSALRSQRPVWRRSLAGLSVVLLTLAFSSIEPALNFYIMFLGLTLYVYSENRQQLTSNLTLLLGSTLALTAFIAILYFVFYVNAEQVSRRGSIDIPSLNRIVDFLHGYHVRAFGSTFGRDIQYVTYREGLNAFLDNPLAIALGILALTSAILAIIDWPKFASQPPDNKSVSSSGRIAILIVFSLATTAATMLLPSVLLSNENGSPRLAYLPGMSFALALGFSMAATSRRFHNSRFARTILVASLSLVLALTLRTSGYTKMYQLRQALDQQQISKLKKAIPPALIGKRSVTFLPISVSDEFIDYHISTNPRHILLGALTSPNSVRTILRDLYTDAVNVIRPRYGEMRWRLEAAADGKTISAFGLPSDGTRTVNSDALIIFRYRKDGVIDIVDQISYQSEGGDTALTITFPWSTRINDAVGTPTFSLNLPYNQPEYVAVRE